MGQYLQTPTKESNSKYELLDCPTYVDSNTFQSTLTTIVIPASVEVIRKRAFYGCTNLTKIELPYGLVEIGDYAFAYCINLAAISNPDTVVTIGDNAFTDCESLRHVKLPQTLKAIGHSVFSDCKSLTDVHIPDSVRCIFMYAFYGCESLVHMTLSTELRRFGYGPFSGCNNLETLLIPGYKLEYIEPGLPKYCPKLKRISMPYYPEMFNLNEMRFYTGITFFIRYQMEHIGIVTAKYKYITYENKIVWVNMSHVEILDLIMLVALRMDVIDDSVCIFIEIVYAFLLV